MRFGAAPLLTVPLMGDPATGAMTATWSIPHPRDPTNTATFVVGITPGGRRINLETAFSVAQTPPWTGTLAAWWFGT